MVAKPAVYEYERRSTGAAGVFCIRHMNAVARLNFMQWVASILLTRETRDARIGQRVRRRLRGMVPARVVSAIVCRAFDPVNATIAGYQSVLVHIEGAAAVQEIHCAAGMCFIGA